MTHGGYRTGAGRPKKTVAQRLQNSNAGKRPIEILNFKQGVDIPDNPASWLSPKAVEEYKKIHEWLKAHGVARGILPSNVEDYAYYKSEWLNAVEQIRQYNPIIKDAKTGRAVYNPYVNYAKDSFKSKNEALANIFAVIRESVLTDWDGTDPNDVDPTGMDAVLSSKY
jgi:phage terminase small subunit